MKRLFVFAIGGTGSRVLKSLIMLLSSGIRLGHFELVPIIVDPHKSNLDLKRTAKLLAYYQKVREKRGPGEEGFFSTSLKMLNQISEDDDFSSDFTFALDGVSNQRYKDYIGYSTLDGANKALASVLFSRNNLETDMDIGFVGNPNLGSVVLDQFNESKEFTHFASSFDDGDRIFIISSIFGGTGAAGFPIILKNIRNAGLGVHNSEFLKNAPIGAVTLLPYFGVAPKEGTEGPKINKATFMSKTRAALQYYKANVSGNNSLNAMYYLGESVSKDYENDPGAGGQQNDAHLVELVAALSLIHFSGLADEDLKTVKGMARDPRYYEYGIKADKPKDNLSFLDLGDRSHKLLTRPLTQFLLFRDYMASHMAEAIKRAPFAIKSSPRLDGALLNSAFARDHLELIFRAFGDWLEEMGQNKPSFIPFNLSHSRLSDAVREVKTKANWFGSSAKLDFKNLEAALNRYEKNQSGYNGPEAKLLDVFYGGTKDLIENYFSNIH